MLFFIIEQNKSKVVRGVKSLSLFLESMHRVCIKQANYNNKITHYSKSLFQIIKLYSYFRRSFCLVLLFCAILFSFYIQFWKNDGSVAQLVQAPG